MSCGCLIVSDHLRQVSVCMYTITGISMLHVLCADGGVCVCPYIDTHILMVATYVAMSDP